jgi:uncharacterized protein
MRSAVALMAAAAVVALAGEKPIPAPTLGDAEKKLFAGIASGETSLVKTALQEGANANCRGTNGYDASSELLRRAKAPLTSSQRECLSILLAAGADPNAADGDSRTLLIQAARIGDFETVRLLTEADAYARARDRFHRTALMYAVEAHRRDIVEYLADNGDLQSHPYAVKRQQRVRK